MLNELRRLSQRIRLGVIGIGSIGKGIVLQSHLTPGIECAAISDICIDRAIACAKWLNRDYVVVDNFEAMHTAILNGRLGVCEDGKILAQCELMDVMIEATNSLAAAGQFAMTALEHRKHVVMMNYEADLMFGPFLSHLAKKKELVYSACDGDQPAVLHRLIEEVEFMGFEIVMAGNIKGYLDRYVNPQSIIPEADKRGLDYKMCTSYTDGTKLCIEMAVLANAHRFRTLVPGMIGPRVKNVIDVFSAFDFEEIWQKRQPVVDYILGAEPTGGVYTIGFTDNPYQQETLAWFPPKMGPGPFYVFYRPYHLGHFQSMATVAEAFLNHRSVLEPTYGFQTNVFAYAKRNLRTGEELDGPGGYTCYGMIKNYSDQTVPGLPICLSDGITLSKDVQKDREITLDDVQFDANREDFKLFSMAMNQSKVE
jgi:predicted homoserine dehydrogenase-like protein